MRYASIIIGVIAVLILVGIAVVFLRGNGAYRTAGTYGAPYGAQPVVTGQTAVAGCAQQQTQAVPVYQTAAAPCPQTVATYPYQAAYQPVQTVPIYQATPVYYQAAAYQTIPTYVVPAAYTNNCNCAPAYGGQVYGATASVYPVMTSAYYPNASWYTAPTQGSYYYGGTTRIIYQQSQPYQYGYQYQYTNTQTIPGYNQTQVYNYGNTGANTGTNFQYINPTTSGGGTWYQ